MTESTRLTPLQIAALSILAEGPMHPYEIYTLMRERREDIVVKLRAGSLYHAIARLADTGLVEATGTDRAGNRPERTTYAVTPAGRAALAATVVAMLRSRAEEYPAYVLAVGELHAAPPEEVFAALAARVDELAADLVEIDRGMASIADRDVPTIYVMDVDLLRALRQAEHDWTARTLDALRSGAIPWPDRPHHLPTKETR